LTKKWLGYILSAFFTNSSDHPAYYWILCRGKLRLENSIYNMKWGSHTLATFSPNCSYLNTYIFRFLWAIETEKRNIYRVIISDTVLFCFAASAATADIELTKKKLLPSSFSN
jgi:hypothetical protein